jgi:hypothetical protein
MNGINASRKSLRILFILYSVNHKHNNPGINGFKKIKHLNYGFIFLILYLLNKNNEPDGYWSWVLF